MESVKLDLDLDEVELRSARDLELGITVKPPSGESGPKLTDLRLELDRASVDLFEEHTIWKTRGHNRFRFRFKPKYLARKMHIEFLIKGYDERGLEYSSEPISKDLTLKNPFILRSYEEKMDKRGIAERRELFTKFNRFLYERSMPVGFVVGPPGIGKTTFLEQWRHWAIKDEKGEQFPIIIIAHPIVTPESSFRDFIWEVDKAIYSDFKRKYRRPLPDDIRKTTTDTFRSLGLPSYSGKRYRGRGAKLEKASRASYLVNPDYYHTRFVQELCQCISKLIESELFRPPVVVAIDDLQDWTLERMGWLLTSMTSLSESLGIEMQVVIAVRYRLDELFGDDRYALKALQHTLLHHTTAPHVPRGESEAISEQRPSAPEAQEHSEPKLYFTLGTLDSKQIRDALTERLPKPWFDWWEIDLATYLESLTGGNPQAVECVSYHWWEMCASPSKLGDVLNQSNLREKEEILEKSLEKKGISVPELQGRRENSLPKLWKRYYEALTSHGLLRKNDKKRKAAVLYLKALAKNQPGVPSEPREGMSREEWRRRVGTDQLDEEVVNCLEQLKLVERQGQSFHLAIPVLCITDFEEPEDE